MAAPKPKKKTIRTIPQARTPMREQEPLVRAKNFDEVTLGYSREEALLEAERCLMCPDQPCQRGCPVGIDIPAFIKKITDKNFHGAYDVITDTNLLPSVCGRVCPQESQCEGVCTVGETLEPVAIGRLERWVGDQAIAGGWASLPYMEPNGLRVGIVGSGPAGMACAADMAKAGCEVTVYEAFHTPGGVLKYGIPDFRLPNSVIDVEIDKLAKLGIKFECNTLVGRLFTIEQMVTEMGFHAVFIGTGAGYPSFMGIPGESLNGVLSANELLTRCNLMRARDFPAYDTPLAPGKRVAVIGAGNTAMDAMRVSLRLGADKVLCIYRRTKAEAPARVEELHHAEEEGVDFRWLTAPVEILGDVTKRVRAIRCITMELGEPDASGRRRPVAVPGSEHEIEVDSVVYAIGTNANPILGQTSKLALDKRGYIATDESLATSIPGVYAGGDIVTGAATVIQAMGAGRKAARGMKAWLGLRDTESIYEDAADGSAGLFGFHPLERTMHASVSPRPPLEKEAIVLDEHIVEVISDSGEGAQRCGQSLGAIAARMGNGIWTTEIIPAEIQPPARSVAGASGIRIRMGSGPVTNGGDETDLVVAFNEQVLLGRVTAGELKPGCTILLENSWREHRDPKVVASYLETVKMLKEGGYKLYELPLEAACSKLVTDPRRGKNMFVLGILCEIYSLDAKIAHDQVALNFGKKDAKVVKVNQGLVDAGRAWAAEHIDFKYRIPAPAVSEPLIVVNGNTALGLGVLASGMDICSMYPITPATSTSHYLSECFERVGGMVHQAEDEIAACAFAVGASYAGKCAVTITSGPGYSLKQEVIGLAVMCEIPLVVINVQRGGPSTGQPTKAEQSDLLTSIYGSHGDAPKVVMAVSGIEDCFYSVITARKIAETFNTVVVLLSDASLATAQQPFPRPKFSEDWLAPPIDQTPVPAGAKPYDWDPVTGIARRFVPGQPGGMHTLTGLAHDRASKVAYDATSNEDGLRSRSLKLAALQKTLKTPEVFGDRAGELLVIGWGSTKGTIEEAVARARKEGLRVSSMHIKYIQPLASGIREILKGFERVMTVETAWSDLPADELIDEDNRRYAPLALILRSRFVVDIDCWGQARGNRSSPARSSK